MQQKIQLWKKEERMEGAGRGDEDSQESNSRAPGRSNNI